MSSPNEERACQWPMKAEPSGVRYAMPKFKLRWLTLSLVAGAGFGCESLRQLDSGTHTDVQQAGGVPSTTAKRPNKHFKRLGAYAVAADFPIDPNDPLFKELESLPDAIQRDLKLPPSSGVIQIFLFDTKENYEAYMAVRYPKLPVRRAYFIAEPRAVGNGDDLLVFTWMGEHLRTDLRHECTHAVLHDVLKAVPLWLDEGLAGYYELAPQANGLNHSHLEAMKANPFQPDLPRLEKLGQVKQMEKPEYRESWAWVHFFLKGPPASNQVLLDYIQKLRTEANPAPMYPKLKDSLGDPHRCLNTHLSGLPSTNR